MTSIQRLARRERFQVEEWVRRRLCDALNHQRGTEPEIKLEAVRRGAKYSFPTADIAEMLNEIARVSD